MDHRLSEKDVFARLFAPSSNLPEKRNGPALVIHTDGVERSVTHVQVENLIAGAMQQLKARGLKEGSNVVFYCENGLEFSPTLLACWALKATTTLVDYRMKRVDLLNVCKKLNTQLLLTSKLHSGLAHETDLIPGAQIDVMDSSQLAAFKDTPPEKKFDIATLAMDHPALLLLTSGTTGAPKTSQHSLRSLAQNILDLADASGLESNMTAVTPLPVSHIFGLSVLLVSQVLGMKTVLTSLDPVGFIKAIHKHKPEMIAALPQFYGAMLSAPDGAIQLKDTKLLLCGGAPLTVSLAEKFERKFGKRLNNGYGSTESKIVAFNYDGPDLSVGKPVGSVQIDIVNDLHEPVPEGRSGEVRITTRTLMSGYLNNEDENGKVLQNGQYYTGDFGRLENGYLFVAGRKSDIILVGGAVIQAGEIEEALRNCSEVKEVAVTAVANKRLGQIIKASVVLLDPEVSKKLKSTNETERVEAKLELQHRFKAFCKEHLSRYKRPMKWEFFGLHDDLPKTLAGKIDKKSMSA
jgi:acyl-CoA synthetase (AMP-forming)/AMP-acid ligase II